MKHVDYIVVGCGLAGIAFCEQLRDHKKTFLVFDNATQDASSVAVGLYNPVVLKRFTAAWNAKKLLDVALPKYKALEELLNVTLNYKLPVYRKFSSVEEQNLWFSASDKPPLDSFLSLEIIRNSNSKIKAPFGFGRVLQTGRIDTDKLIKNYRKYLEVHNLIVHESFDYNALAISNQTVEYKTVTAKHIVFAEGNGMTANPFFKDLPLNPLKGEIITIKAPDLNFDVILKSSVFVVPIEKDLYAVGATYNWKDKTNMPTKNGKEELIGKLQSFVDCNFEVVDHKAGLRPTVIDRRPLVGMHSKHKNLSVLNGLGTHGVMNAPYVAEQLYNLIENNVPLDKEIDIKRFVR